MLNYLKNCYKKLRVPFFLLLVVFQSSILAAEQQPITAEEGEQWIQYAEEGKIEEMKKLLAKNPNYLNWEKDYWHRGNRETRKHYKAFTAAARHNLHDTFIFLIEESLKLNRPPLNINSIDIEFLMIYTQDPVSIVDRLVEKTLEGQLNMQLNLDGEKNIALFLFLTHWPDIVAKLLYTHSRGIDIGLGRTYPLLLLFSSGAIVVLQTFIEKVKEYKLDLNYDQADYYGNTPFMSACNHAVADNCLDDNYKRIRIILDAIQNKTIKLDLNKAKVIPPAEEDREEEGYTVLTYLVRQYQEEDSSEKREIVKHFIEEMITLGANIDEPSHFLAE